MFFEKNRPSHFVFILPFEKYNFKCFEKSILNIPIKFAAAVGVKFKNTELDRCGFNLRPLASLSVIFRYQIRFRQVALIWKWSFLREKVPIAPLILSQFWPFGPARRQI